MTIAYHLHPSLSISKSDPVSVRDRVYQGFIDFLRKQVPSPGTGQDRTLPPARSLLERLRRLGPLYQPPEKAQYHSWQKLQDSPWVEKALATEGVKFYYWFARFPIVKSVNTNDGRHRVEFTDVRFFTPTLRMPFVYYVEFDDSGKMTSDGFVEDQKR